MYGTTTNGHLAIGTTAEFVAVYNLYAQTPVRFVKYATNKAIVQIVELPSGTLYVQNDANRWISTRNDKHVLIVDDRVIQCRTAQQVSELSVLLKRRSCLDVLDNRVVVWMHSRSRTLYFYNLSTSRIFSTFGKKGDETLFESTFAVQFINDHHLALATSRESILYYFDIDQQLTIHEVKFCDGLTIEFQKRPFVWCVHPYEKAQFGRRVEFARTNVLEWLIPELTSIVFTYIVSDTVSTT